MFEAERRWSFRHRELSRVFRFQYCLSRKPVDNSFLDARAFAGQTLYVGRELPVADVIDMDGREVGLLLGMAVGPAGFLSGRVRLPVAAGSPDFWDRFTDFLAECAGRFGFFLCRNGECRLYTDPIGMIGAVVAPHERRVASSPLLALTRPVVPNPRYEEPALRCFPAAHFTLFHTCDAHVRRLNPSTYLDLNSYETHRFWPRDELFSMEGTGHAETYDEIIERLEFNIAEFVAAKPCVLPVSGGRDSRILAAVGRNSLSGLVKCYTHIKNYAGEVDAHVGGAVARSLGVEHEVLGSRRGVASQKWERRFLKRAYAITRAAPAPPPDEYLAGAIDAVPENTVILRGHQTDLLRAVYVFEPKPKWREARWQIERMLIVPRADFTDDIASLFEEDFHEWQGGLPDNAMEKAADFMFLEVYYNSTLGAMFPALWQHFYLSPFNSRRLIALALRFDEADRRRMDPVYDIIQKCAPECAKVPFYGEGGSHFPDLSDPEAYEEITRDRVAATAARLADVYGR